MSGYRRIQMLQRLALILIVIVSLAIVFTLISIIDSKNMVSFSESDLLLKKIQFEEDGKNVSFGYYKDFIYIFVSGNESYEYFFYHYESELDGWIKINEEDISFVSYDLISDDERFESAILNVYTLDAYYLIFEEIVITSSNGALNASQIDIEDLWGYDWTLIFSNAEQCSYLYISDHNYQD